MATVATAPATWYVAKGGNDTWWRVDVPAKAVGANVVELTTETVNHAILDPNKDSQFPWHLSGDYGKHLLPDAELLWGTDAWKHTLDRFRYPQHEGAAVWTRPCSLRARHTLAMQQQGIRTIAELDDNYLSDPMLNVYMRANGYGAEQRLNHLKAQAAHDAIVFSTAWLRDEYFKTIRKELGKRRVPELFVARNHIDLDEIPTPAPPREDGRLRIGWMGSGQHIRDLKLVYGALEWAASQGHIVYVIGLDPFELSDRTGKRWDIPTEHIPWVSPEEYHRTPLPLDIGLIPLEYNNHTLGKSDCKALEYTVSGAAVIAQNMPVYNGTWTHGETCLLANSPDEFGHMLQELVARPALRERLVTAATEYVREERSIQTQAHEWLDAING